MLLVSVVDLVHASVVLRELRRLLIFRENAGVDTVLYYLLFLGVVMWIHEAVRVKRSLLQRLSLKEVHLVLFGIGRVML